MTDRLKGILRFITQKENYDLISGKVNEVRFNPDRINPATGELLRNEDKGFHRYSYDAENRLTEVRTSRDGIEWERDAAYHYYKHGPLRRTELGQQLVQGVDYAYTLQGWLKGVNTTTLPSNTVGAGALLYDMGKDGQLGHTNGKVARDVYGFGLHYFDDGSNQDYKPIGGTSVFARPNNGQFLSLYNGNIGGMSVNLHGAAPAGTTGTGSLAEALFYRYRYDQLNRIVSMQAYNGLQGNNTWQPVSLQAYKESVSYDPNGNILSYDRNGKDGQLAMDNMTYGYNVSGGKLQNNRLRHVKDAIGDAAYTEDIDNQGDDNYTYDAIGNLTADAKEGVSNIAWNVYGKILSVTKSTGTISYSYDASGNRITKTVGGVTTVYVRDASGNVMGVYTKKAATSPVQTEWHLYGSSRLGLQGERTVVTQNITLSNNFAAGRKVIFTRGEKFFELSNHLGNVLVTVSDRKLQNTSDNQTVSYYTADVASATDYYPFGMQMPGRKYTAGSSYRYGFNGKENDTETGTQDYGFRIYNPALGKFLSVDPLSKGYPWYTPYQYAGNKPIQCIHLDGLEPVATTHVAQMTGVSPKLKPGQWYVIEGQAEYYTFQAAARYNVKINNPGAYQSIEDRHNWYVWAAEQTRSKGNFWFAAAADVTSANMVGAADRINFGFANDEEEKILRGANEFLLTENFKNFGSYAMNEGWVKWGDKVYSANIQGRSLDMLMVVIEMNTLQQYLDHYKEKYIKEKGAKKWETLHKGLNAMFSNSFTRLFTPSSNKYAYVMFKKEYGKDAKFDFMNLEHRIFQGQQMAEYLRDPEAGDARLEEIENQLSED